MRFPTPLKWIPAGDDVAGGDYGGNGADGDGEHELPR